MQGGWVKKALTRKKEMQGKSTTDTESKCQTNTLLFSRVLFVKPVFASELVPF